MRIMASKIMIPQLNVGSGCEGQIPLFTQFQASHTSFSGCGGVCHSKSSCDFLHILHDTACKRFHCQACLMPLSHQQGINMHPSPPSWKSCAFRYKDQLARYLVQASLGVHIRARLPPGFPVTGPDAAMHWAFSQKPGCPPNIVLFLAALLGFIWGQLRTFFQWEVKLTCTTLI